MSNKEREALHSQQVSAGRRKYYFDVMATKEGDKFITISESRRMFNNTTGAFYFDKSKVFLYKEDFGKFQQALKEAMGYVLDGEPSPSATESPAGAGQWCADTVPSPNCHS